MAHLLTLPLPLANEEELACGGKWSACFASTDLRAVLPHRTAGECSEALSRTGRVHEVRFSRVALGGIGS